MVEDAVHFLSKETMVQAIARSATKVRPFLLQLKTLSFYVFTPRLLLSVLCFCCCLWSQSYLKVILVCKFIDLFYQNGLTLLHKIWMGMPLNWLKNNMVLLD